MVTATTKEGAARSANSSPVTRAVGILTYSVKGTGYLTEPAA